MLSNKRRIAAREPTRVASSLDAPATLDKRGCWPGLIQQAAASSRSTRCMRAASSRLCVAIRAATPVCWISSSSSWKTCADVCGSRLPVGSSASRSLGALASARAMAVRCCSPPDSCAGRWSSRSAEPQHAQQLAARALRRRARPRRGSSAACSDVLERRELRQQLVELVDEAHLDAPHARALGIAQAASSPRR